MDIRYNQFIPQRLQVRVSKSPLSAEFRPPHFEPYQVVGIISYTHLIRLRIPDSNIHIHNVVHATLLDE
jgi:hypothetical protein